MKSYSKVPAGVSEARRAGKAGGTPVWRIGALDHLFEFAGNARKGEKSEGRLIRAAYRKGDRYYLAMFIRFGG